MSPTELVARYLAERARLRVFAPLALLITAVVWIVARPVPASVSRFAQTAGQALALILAFRVWDDLEDRARDAREHPSRVMVIDPRTAPFVGLAVALAVAGLVWTAQGPGSEVRIAVLGGAAIILLLWYRLRGAASPGVLSGHVVLIKYPAIAFSVAPMLPQAGTGAAVWRTAVGLVSLYLALCVYESFDDPTLRASRTARGIALTELLLIVSLIATTLSIQGAVAP